MTRWPYIAERKGNNLTSRSSSKTSVARANLGAVRRRGRGDGYTICSTTRDATGALYRSMPYDTMGGLD